MIWASAQVHGSLITLRADSAICAASSICVLGAVAVRAVRNVGAARALLALNVEAPSRTARRQPSAP
jgi:hypothetical protein